MLRCVSLFTGAGGLDIGLVRAGFRVVFATDSEDKCRESYTHADSFGGSTPYFVANISDVDRTDIESSVGESLDDLDLLAGGPPCPPYSKSRFYRKEKPRGINDPIGDETLRGYLRLLEQLQPRAFLFENVHGFAYKVHPEGHRLLTATAQRLGYHTADAVLNAADFGIPQIRRRFFMVGRKDGEFRFPIPSHIDPQKGAALFEHGRLPTWRSSGDAISDLDTAENASDEGHYAGGRFNHLLKEVPPGDNYLFFTEKRGHPNPVFKWRSRYWSFLLKLDPDRPSWTIQARRSNNMGPFHWQSRMLRIMEVRRLQTFPDCWFLSGTVEDQWRQVGNAVPPLLAEVIGREIAKCLGGSGKPIPEAPQLPSFVLSTPV